MTEIRVSIERIQLPIYGCLPDEGMNEQHGPKMFQFEGPVRKKFMCRMGDVLNLK